MNEWHVVYGFYSKDNLDEFLALPKYTDEETMEVHRHCGEAYLGLFLVDVDNLMAGTFSELCPEANNYKYFVFWEVGMSFVKKFGFFDVEN